jgi:hypothetical protein
MDSATAFLKKVVEVQEHWETHLGNPKEKVVIEPPEYKTESVLTDFASQFGAGWRFHKASAAGKRSIRWRIFLLMGLLFSSIFLLVFVHSAPFLWHAEQHPHVQECVDEIKESIPDNYELIGRNISNQFVVSNSLPKLKKIKLKEKSMKIYSRSIFYFIALFGVPGDHFYNQEKKPEETPEFAQFRKKHGVRWNVHQGLLSYAEHARKSLPDTLVQFSLHAKKDNIGIFLRFCHFDYI